MLSRVVASFTVTLSAGFLGSARGASRRLRRLLAELDYAQRRLCEIQTGLVLTPETSLAIARAEINRLNALYAYDC